MKWEPWELYKNKAPIVIEDIDNPPCSSCKFWNPRVKTDARGEFDGVVFCTSNDMYHDFSCFKQRKD